MSEPVPARRSPSGYVAQRLYPDDGGALGTDSVRRPWLLTHIPSDAPLTVTLLTDDEVADWPEMNP